MSSDLTEHPAPEHSLPAEAHRTWALLSLLRLRWFIHLRWAFVIVAFAALALERFVIPQAQRPWQLAAVILAVAAVNVCWLIASQLMSKRFEFEDTDPGEARRSARLFANAQVAIDLLLLTMILRFSGGIENPMAIFYVFHIAIAALLLSRRQAIAQAVWAIALYTVLGVGELLGLFAPHFPLLSWKPSPGWHADPYFVGLTVLVYSCGFMGVLYFTLQIALRLDKRDRQLLAANAALQKSKTAIQDLQQRRSRFMQTAAHQLKSPLAVISTLAALIRDEVVPPDGVRRTAEKIVTRCREGIDQVSELLTLARVQEADPARYRSVFTNVGQVAEELCRRYQPLAKEKSLAFTWTVAREMDFRSHIDESDAKDCIGNLIENAVKYTNEGGVHIKVACLTADQLQHSRTVQLNGKEDGFVFVTVKDTGIGIDKAALTDGGRAIPGTIFDAFCRGNNALASGIPGTGLGLSIVREVVEQAGGYISVHSRPGKGSTFTIMFPAYRRPSTADVPIRDTRASEVVIERDEEDKPQSEPDKADNAKSSSGIP